MSSLSRDGFLHASAFLFFVILRVLCVSGLFGRFWGTLGRSWTLLGRSWGTLGASWAALGALLAALGALLGPSWEHLGASWRHLGENIEKTSFSKPFWHPKWRPKSSKIVLKKRCAFHDAIVTFFVDV